MLSIVAGYDPGYLTRSVGKGAENYYLSAVAEHGEPPGIWWGEGARVLGLEPGAVVENAVMEKLFSTFLDPRDLDFLNKDVPDEEKSHLGRRPQAFKSAEEILAARLAAEPEATAERVEELRIEAARTARRAVYFFDLTFSPTKSVSLLHAGLQASAVQARQAGNVEQAAAYDRAAEAVWEAVMAGASASIAYARDHAGAARAGYHGVSVEGRSTGRWIEAGDWVVSQFRQHTNREGEPQLHVHQAVLNRQLCSDGQWRTLDSRALHRVRAAAAAVGERVMEEQLTRVLGVEWRGRPDGHGREVVGVTQEQIEAFSTRRVQVTADLEQRIADYEAAHGRKPSARAIFKLAQDATKATKARKPKSKDAPSRAEALAEWERRTTEQEIEQLTQIPGAALGRVSPEKQAAHQERLAELNIRRVVEAAVVEAQAAKAAFSRYELIRYISRHLPDHLGGLPAERVEALLEELADIALDPAGTAGVRLLTAPERVEVPAELRRADGRSVYEAPCAQRYTTVEQLDTETEVIVTALGTDAPRLDAAAAAASLGVEVAPDGRVGRLEGMAGTLRLDQAAAVYGIVSSGRRADVLVGPAGAGKSYTVARMADLWRAQSGGRVVGLTTAQNAAQVLRGEGLDIAHNITRWLGEVERGVARLEPGALVIIDEASMVTTAAMQKIMRCADRAGAKIVLTGDQAQLGAPGVGGMMRQLVATAGAYELVDVQRMAEQWERDASLRLRDGDAQVLREYDRRGRLREGTREEMEQAAYEGYLADLLSGRRSLLLVPTNETAGALSARVRAELVAYGIVTEGGVTLRDGNVAGAGDLIMARKNDYEMEIGADARPLTNRDVLRVEAIGAGTLRARLLDKDGRPGELVTIESDYVAQHIELAYAGTVHAAQGRTVDTCHSLIDDQVTRQMLYVMLSRAKEGNYAYAVTGQARQADLRPGPDQTVDAPEPSRTGDGLAVLAAALERTEDDQTALEALRAETQRPSHMGHLGSMWLDMVRTYTADAYITQAQGRGLLTGEEAEQLRADEAVGTLGRLLRQLEMAGLDAAGMLEQAIGGRELATADSLAQVIHWRITRIADDLGVEVARLEPDEAQIRGTWMDRTPHLGRDGIDRFATQLALEMERRTVTLGHEAAERPPAWLIEQIGEPPAVDTVERGEWIDRAGRVMAYREQYGYEVTTDAIGPAPSRANPEQRMAWYSAYDALGRPEAERDVSAATLGELWVMRAAYERDARWAPPYVADDLKATAIAAREHAAEAVRLRAQAAAMTAPEVAAGLLAQAAGLEAMAAELEVRRAELAEIDEARQAWHAATEDARVMAMRADAELRRRPEVEVELLPPLHHESKDAAAAQVAETAPSYEAHEGQMTLDLPEVDEHTTGISAQEQTREEAEHDETALVIEDAAEELADQLSLDLYGEAGGQEETAAAILRARAARAIAEARRDEEPEATAERLRLSQTERIAAEAYAEHEAERLVTERTELEQREADRGEEITAAQLREVDRGEEMSL